jgi:hypothetical protein
VTRDEFDRRFAAAGAGTAARAAIQTETAVPIPTAFQLSRQGFGGRPLTFHEAAATMYLGPDVAFRVGGDDDGVGWIRPSGHHPGPDTDIWDPSGIGPFKVIGAIWPAHD